MKNEFRLLSDILDNLNDEELHLLINIIPKEELLNYIKKNPKEFRNETRGLKIDIKSKILMGKISNACFDKIKKHHVNITNMVLYYANITINGVNNHIFEVTSVEDFLEEAISSNNIDNFDKLISIILDKLKPECIKLFFKLVGKKLSDDQSNYIDMQIKTIIIKKELSEKIYKKLEKEYKSKITTLENEYKIEISNGIQKINEVKEKLNAMNIKLSDGKRNSNLLHSEIEKIKIEKINENNTLQNHIKKLNFTIEKMEEEKTILKSSIQDKDLTIENLNKQLCMKYIEYSYIAQGKWDVENEKLINAQKSLYKECEDLKKTKMVLRDGIEALENEKVQTENKISEYKNIVSRFIENIDQKLIEKALYESLLKYNTENSRKVLNRDNKINNLYIKNNKVEANIKKCDNIYDFATNIADNLENIGVKDTADEVVDYIIGILAAGMTPLICGYRAREIATSISVSYSGETPYIITLPNGYTDSKELFELYNLAESNVVLIEDAVGTMNENALMPLLRERSQKGFSHKLLLLSSENEDSVRYMPFSLLNQVALVMINKYGVQKSNEYKFSDAQNVLGEFILSSGFQKECKMIKKLLVNLKLGNPYEILRSLIIGYSQQLSNPNAALKGYLESELMFICKCNNMLSDLEMNIKKYQLGDDLAEIVRGGLNE